MAVDTAARQLLDEVTQWVYREARLQDEHRYDEWEALWTDDGIYWVPANGEGGDPEQEMSIIYDNRSRIALRIRQFHTGNRRWRRADGRQQCADLRVARARRHALGGAQRIPAASRWQRPEDGLQEGRARQQPDRTVVDGLPHLNGNPMSQDTPEVLVGTGHALLTLHADGVAHVQMNRPEAANGMNVEMLEALQAVLMRVHGDDRVRAVLLTGEGRNFCAGGDVHTFLSKGQALPGYIRQATAMLENVVALMMRMNPPVVSAVHGFAAGGGGMGLVCSSDFVVAAASAKFLGGATRVAMVPDAGVTVTLVQLVGLRKAMEIAMLNPTITAPEALAMGLVTRVVADEQLLDEAWSLARQLAGGAPAALAATKRLLWSGIGRTVDAAMPEENRLQGVLSGMADAREGLAAVIDKRAPKFEGR